LFIGAKADHVNQKGGALLALGGGQVEKPAIKVQRFLGIEEAVQVRLFGQEPNALILLDLGGRRIENQGIAVGGKEQAQQQLDRRGLARAVWPQQAEDFAPVDR